MREILLRDLGTMIGERAENNIENCNKNGLDFEKTVADDKKNGGEKGKRDELSVNLNKWT